MTEKEITQLINHLRSTENSDEAYIGFFQYDDLYDEGYIKANKQGLKLHAAELLAVALEKEKALDNENIFKLDLNIFDEDSEIRFNHITLQNEKRQEITSSQQKPISWKRRVSSIGFFALGIGLIFLAVIGFVTTINWLV